MLLLFVGIYVLLTIIIGVFSSRLVKNPTDFILAGHRLPMFMATSTIFATWFGSETVMGASAQMSEEGILGVIEDPFGASLCLILVGLFYARPLYRLNLLTFGDFYRLKFGRTAELIAAVFLIISYFGWIAAQMVAMGIIISLISGVDTHIAIVLSSLAVVIYTSLGGMWAVSITDSIQTVFIIVGIVAVTVIVLPMAGGFEKVIDNTPEHFFHFYPRDGSYGWMYYIAAWLTLGLGSIPQQDVYQRVMASRSEKIAVRSSILAGFMYFTIALFPLLLGLVAKQVLTDHPEDLQYLLPNLILQKTGIFIQILFFGALLSAIMSTASGALLAPSVILSENILRTKKMREEVANDKKRLTLTRISVVIVAVVSLIMALSRQNIYELVGEASAISLVSLFVPLTAGLLFKSTSQRAAVISMIAGLGVWFICEWIETPVPSIFYGTLASLMGFVLGTILQKRS